MGGLRRPAPNGPSPDSTPALRHAGGESGLNDPPAVLAVTLLSDIGHHPPSPALTADEIVYQLAAGAAIGVLAGVLGAQALRRVALPASGLYPIPILALIVASYGAATVARASGFLAVYVSALVLGNARLPHGPAIRGFAEGVAWLAQIGLLGLSASPARLPAQIIPAIVVGSVLALLAQPAAVQGTTLPWAARQLKVTTPAEPLDMDVEAAPLEALHADLLQAQIPPAAARTVRGPRRSRCCLLLPITHCSLL